MLAIVLLLIFGGVGWVIWANTAVELSRYSVSCSQLPEAFDGYRVALVSDLHATEMGESHETILALLREAEPDMIAITGDLVDSRTTYVQSALQFVQEALQIAPCYYVSGNHEGRLAARGSEYNDLKAALEAAGVVILDDRSTQIDLDGAAITVLGVNDPRFRVDFWRDDTLEFMDAKLKELNFGGDDFTLLLSHRPELFDAYVSHGVDLVLSGHVHGGQIRVPFVGGLVAPDQGVFPKYDAGLFAQDRTQMIVSRGLGKSIFPLRVNNRPEIILIELKCT